MSIVIIVHRLIGFHWVFRYNGAILEMNQFPKSSPAITHACLIGKLFKWPDFNDYVKT